MIVDRSNLTLKSKWQFKPFHVPIKATPIADLNLPSDMELIVIERRGERRAFSVLEMAYHHIAQGELAGEPYLVTF